MDNLQQLVEMFGGPVAAYKMGEKESRTKEQFSLEQAARELANQASQQKFDINAEQRPATLEALLLGNEQTAARIPGIKADSESRVFDQGVKEQLGQKFFVDEKLRESLKKKADSEVEDMNRTSRHILQLGPMLQEIGPAAPLFLKEQLTKLNVRPEMIDHFVKMSPQKLMEIAQRNFDTSEDVLKEKSKQKDMMERNVTLENVRGANQRSVEQMRIDAGKYQKTGRVSASINDQIASGKLSYEKAATLLSGSAFLAEQEGDTEKAQAYYEMADQYNRKALALRSAGQATAAAGKPDLNAMGIQTNQPVPAEPFQSTRQPQTQQQNQQNVDLVSKANQIPQGAIEMLKKNPQLKAQFDAKYGQGMSELILRK